MDWRRWYLLKVTNEVGVRLKRCGNDENGAWGNANRRTMANRFVRLLEVMAVRAPLLLRCARLGLQNIDQRREWSKKDELVI